MVGASAADDALRRARLLPRLHLGLHIALVDGAPVLPPERIPDLVDASGRLRTDLTRLAFEIACRPSLLHQLRSEITAQFEAYHRSGLPLDHVDVHKHFHLHPLVAREIVTIGLGFGMRALRVPMEPCRPLRQIDRNLNGASCRFMQTWAAVLRAHARRSGLAIADAVFGVQWSGALTRDRMIALLAHLPPGLVEIYSHPAMTDTFHGHVPGYRYVDELAALCAPEALTALQRSGFRLGGYRDALDENNPAHPAISFPAVARPMSTSPYA